MRDVCFYDGACGLCRRSVRILRAIDWFGALAFRDLTETQPGDGADDLPVTIETAMQGMPMRCGDGLRILGIRVARSEPGRALVGFPAVRRALVQTPVGLLPAAILYVPGIAWVGRQVYGVIAANRGRDACRVDFS
jgi:predicted DCC family thiol-disulfide oxidoreductase YuxK